MQHTHSARHCNEVLLALYALAAARDSLRMYSAAPHNAVVSTDAAGMLELWDPITLALPHSITFKFKSDTGLYDLAKAKTHGKSIEVPLTQASPHTPTPCSSPHPPKVSPTGDLFSVVTSSKKILVFRIATGRRCAEIDESLDIAHESQKHSKVCACPACVASRLVNLTRPFTSGASAVAGAHRVRAATCT